MVPETITVTPTLPKTSTGKIDRQALLRQHEALGEDLPAEDEIAAAD
jgi:acyl-coenzyme A synthetase/AMP-(fatty) acid ligase